MPAPHGALPHRLWQSVPTRVQCGFPGTTWTTTARASPSESGALGFLKGRATSCATYVRHSPFVSGPPIRRHVLDPRRRKSSMVPRPFEAGDACSNWSILSTRARGRNDVRPCPNRHRRWLAEEPLLLNWPLPGLELSRPGERAGYGQDGAGPKRPQILRWSGLPCNRPVAYGGFYLSKKSGRYVRRARGGTLTV